MAINDTANKMRMIPTLYLSGYQFLFFFPNVQFFSTSSYAEKLSQPPYEFKVEDVREKAYFNRECQAKR